MNNLHPSLARAISPIVSRKVDRAPRVEDTVLVLISDTEIAFERVMTTSLDADGKFIVNKHEYDDDTMFVIPMSPFEFLFRAFGGDAVQMRADLFTRGLRRIGKTVTQTSAGQEAIFRDPHGSSFVVDQINTVETSWNNASPRGYRKDDDRSVAVCTL